MPIVIAACLVVVAIVLLSLPVDSEDAVAEDEGPTLDTRNHLDD